MIQRATPDTKAVPLGGFDTIVATRAQMAEHMAADCLAQREAREAGAPALPKLVFSSNGQGISLAAQDAAFAGVMGEADVIHADGMSVVLASRLRRTPLPERIATTDFFHDAALEAERLGLSFFILGGSEAQNQAACAAIARSYPQLRIAGRRNGYFPRTEDRQVCAEIVASRADVLWVGMGKPLQEFWSVQNRGHLRGVGWLKTCGGLYEFLAGEKRRAPKWMQDFALEWAWRTMQDPRRLLWRYCVTNPHSLVLLLFGRRATRTRAIGGSV